MLELRGITKRFGGKAAVQDVSFRVEEGEIVALLGPSGSGKSTLLNVVAGLERPDEGSVLWKGKDLLNVPPHARGFGLMFQDYALFPHRDVAGNVAFGLEMAGEDGEKRAARVAELLDLVGLRGFERRDVSDLSGGEQQRVALARALAPQPRLLMLDEPLGSLDRALRERLLKDLERILRRSGQTSLYVTHDQEEAYAIADRIVLLQAGRVAQQGPPEALYRQPASAFVARFLGLDNLLEAEVVETRNGFVAETAIGRFPLPDSAKAGKGMVLLRPDRVRVGGKGTHRLRGMVRARHFRGNTTVLDVEIEGNLLRFEVVSEEALPDMGDAVELHFDAGQAIQLIPNG